MIVAGSEPKGTIMIGLCPADIEQLQAGLTKTKQGNEQYGFRQLVVFFGESDQANIELLSKAQGGKPIRRVDDIHPNAGAG